jgi:hypothetical protein
MSQFIIPDSQLQDFEKDGYFNIGIESPRFDADNMTFFQFSPTSVTDAITSFRARYVDENGKEISVQTLDETEITYNSDKNIYTFAGGDLGLTAGCFCYFQIRNGADNYQSQVFKTV